MSQSLGLSEGLQNDETLVFLGIDEALIHDLGLVLFHGADSVSHLLNEVAALMGGVQI